MSLCRVLVASFALFVAANPALVRAQQPEPTASPAPAASETKIETIVLIRHGEKPADDEGQLSCQGLNRALALPAVLEKKFGRADFIVAPITAKKPSEHGPAYYTSGR